MNEELKRFNEPKKLNRIANIILGILIVLLIIIIVLTQIFTFSQVVGGSMLNTMKSGDYLVCVAPNSLTRGDIVTADASSETEEKNIVKRIVGMPGDKLVFVSYGEGRIPLPEAKVELYIDSGDGFKLFSEDYISQEDGIMTEKGFYSQKLFFGENRIYHLYYGDIAKIQDGDMIVLGDDEYFLMGDNRNNSTDSRNYGPFKKDKILGKVVSIVSDGGLYDFISFYFSVYGKYITEII